MNYNFVKVGEVWYLIKCMSEVGFYIQVDGVAKTARTKDELIIKLKEQYGTSNVTVFNNQN